MINVPPDVQPFVDRMTELEREGRYDEALAAARDVVDRFPHLAVLHNNLGCSLANLQFYGEAAVAFARAVELTPQNRARGIITPASYPQEPTNNQNAVRELLAGRAAAVPARTRSGEVRSNPASGPEPFARRVLSFVTSPRGAWLMLALGCMVFYVRRTRPDYYPAAISISCVTVLLAAAWYTRL